MKLLIPLFTKLPIDSGASLRNLKTFRGFSQDTDLIVKLWSGFEVLEEARVKFGTAITKHFFLTDLFSIEQIARSGIATVEFDCSLLPDSAKDVFHKNAMEVQFLLKTRSRHNRASVLFDLIPDKKPGHTYTPILHAGHTAWVDETTDSTAVLINFRPPYLQTSQEQKMLLQAKSASGEVLSQREIQIPFNSTLEFSYKEEFSSVGGFQPGSQLNFMGGSSQFGIFTVFLNQKTEAIGIEHSLPPYYYCSGVFQPGNRQKFYQRAFAELRGT